MKVFLLLLLALALGAEARAVLNSPEPWLFGTLPYETIPVRESNWSYQATAPSAGIWEHVLAVQTGFTDRLEGGLGLGNDGLQGTLRFRLAEQDQYPLDLGILGGGAWTGWAEGKMQGMGLAGLLAAKQVREQEFSFNARMIAGSGDPAWMGSLAWRSPYWLEGLRLGLEAKVRADPSAVSSSLAPQLSYDFPGDLSAALGLESDGRVWRAGLRLSYLIFPNL
jgi:hypothetical protein